MHDQNSFLTLTYRDEDLPAYGSLVRSHFPAFMKKLRDRLDYVPLKYFMCGEYGKEYGRPHYHAILFGYQFNDLEPLETSDSGFVVYSSAKADEVWGYGNVRIGEVTYQSARYCAGYVNKKVTGDAAAAHYERISEFGEVVSIEPEYSTQSNGIGKDFALQYAKQILDCDFIIHEGKKHRVPRYYTDLLLSEEQKRKLSAKRSRAASKHEKNQTGKRLHDRESCQLERSSLLLRKL